MTHIKHTFTNVTSLFIVRSSIYYISKFLPLSTCNCVTKITYLDDKSIMFRKKSRRIMDKLSDEKPNDPTRPTVATFIEKTYHLLRNWICHISQIFLLPVIIIFPPFISSWLRCPFSSTLSATNSRAKILRECTFHLCNYNIIWTRQMNILIDIGFMYLHSARIAILTI